MTSRATILLVLVMAACGGDSSATDSGLAVDGAPDVDGGPRSDLGTTDAGGGSDMGIPGDGGMSVDSGPATCASMAMGTDHCGMCVGSMCCSQFNACQADPTCTTFLACLDGCSGGDMTCDAACMTAAGGSTTVSGFTGCLSGPCGGSCM